MAKPMYYHVQVSIRKTRSSGGYIIEREYKDRQVIYPTKGARPGGCR